MGPRRDLVDEERPYKIPRVHVAASDPMDIDSPPRASSSGGVCWETEPLQVGMTTADRDKRCHDLYVHDSDSDGEYFL
jgi:hypothetical protein